MITSFLAGHLFLTCCLGADPAPANAAVLQISRTVPKLLPDAASVSVDNEFRNYKNTQAELIQANFVLTATLRRPEIAALPMIVEHKANLLSWLRQHLEVTFPGDAEILRLTFTDGPAAERATFLNALTESYLSEIVNAEREDRLRVRDKLDREYKIISEEVRARMDALYNLRRSFGVTEEMQQTRKRLDEKQLEGFAERRNKLQERIQDLEIRLALPGKPAGPSEDASLKAEYEACKQQLAKVDALIEKQVEKIQAAPTFSADIETRARELEALESLQKRLKSELQSASVNINALPRVRMVEDASAK